MKLLFTTLLLALISSGAYRLGGIGKPFNTKFRDLGCPLVFTIWMLTNHFPLTLVNWLMITLMFGLMFGALTTYWDFLFGFDNHWFHGFMIGLATFPLFWAGLHWWAILLYSLGLAVSMGAWSEAIGKDWLEEGGRGLFIILLAPLLFL